MFALSTSSKPGWKTDLSSSKSCELLCVHINAKDLMPEFSHTRGVGSP